MAKRILAGTLAALCALLSLYALAVYVIDPYMHYHAPWLGMRMQRSDDSRYENYGIARFADYDAIVMGTSVMQNLRASQFDALYGTHAIKSKFAGSYFAEIGDFLRYAFSHKDGEIKTVFWVLDLTHVLSSVSTRGHSDNPTYLYDDTFLNDVRYLLNKDVAPDLLRPVFDLSPLNHDHRTWDDETGLAVLQAAYAPTRPKPQSDKPFTPEVEAQVLENYETNILSIAREHESTQFIFVIPPGNGFYWDYVTRDGLFTQNVEGLRTAMDAILSLPNVRLFSYVADDAKTDDLGRFRDRVHFDPDMMSEIVASTAAGDGLVTRETLDSEIERIYAKWGSFGYDALYTTPAE